MALHSLHRLTPLAQRFYVSKTSKEFCLLCVILGMFAIAPSSFPGLPIFLPRCDCSQTLVLGFMSPSSRVGRNHFNYTKNIDVKPS